MSPDSVWITGPTRSGKTARLIEQFSSWAQQAAGCTPSRNSATILIMAATGDNRIDLANRIATETQGQYPFESATPLGFFQDEVILFWPLLVQQLALRAVFPLRLRPETEQELATRLWRTDLDAGNLRQEGVKEYYLVRRTLDLLQLAAVAGIPHEDIATVLQDGFSGQDGSPDLWNHMGEALERWRAWCLDRGLLTYGIVTELYWRYLLPHPIYQQHLKRRYWAVLADDLDEYPAIARSLFTALLDQDISVAFTYNPDGGIRLGLGADPNYLAGLAASCRIEELAQQPGSCLGATWGTTVLGWLQEPMLLPQLPESIRSIQTVSRSELLRQTAELIADAVHTGQIQPQDVAIIGPGLDSIARYTLREILVSKGVPVASLHDQQPLASSPLVRALLTLLALVYPGLGRLLSREAIAELLIVFSQAPLFSFDQPSLNQPSLNQPSLSVTTDWEEEELKRQSLSLAAPVSSPNPVATARIDPVRAGLLTDYCFMPDPNQPRLLPATAFPRWDRLGYQATHAYGEFLQWLETQQLQQQQRLIPNPVILLDRAIQRFLFGGNHLPYDQLAALRELMETAQHYWEIDNRLRQYSHAERPIAITVGHFIQLLRNGTITADPYPVRPLGQAGQAVELATIYQYRSDRRSHRWQFWLDAGSPFWLTGGGGLFGAPLMLRQWSGRPWTTEDALAADQQRLQRQVLDLLNRTTERVYLCHSDLAINGQEQVGALLTLINAALPVNPPDIPPDMMMAIDS